MIIGNFEVNRYIENITILINIKYNILFNRISVAPKPNRTEITEKFTEPKCFGFGSALILFYRSIRFSVRLLFHFTEIFGFRFGFNFILPKFSVFRFGPISFYRKFRFSVRFQSHFTEIFGFRFGSNIILPNFRFSVRF